MTSFYKTLILMMSLASYADASFRVLPTSTRVVESEVIAIIEVIKENSLNQRFDEVVVINALLGVNNKDTIKVWKHTKPDSDGKEWITLGRNPYLKKGKRYLIYLKKNKMNRYVTISSSHDCIPIIKDKIRIEADTRVAHTTGYEPIQNRIDLIQHWLRIKRIAQQNLHNKSQ